MRFNPAYPIDQLEPADYNPRRIEPDAFERLKRSLELFGVVKPLILNGPAKVAAGHQRLRALQDLGAETAPIILLDHVRRDDEIRFNLMHNRVEESRTEARVSGAGSLAHGYSPVRHHRLSFQENRNPVVTTEIAKLITRYGPWGCLVVDHEGRVIENSDYAVAAALMRQDVLVYKMTEEEARRFENYINCDYGCYDFAALDIRPFVQHRCQMKRLRPGAKRLNRSKVYENLVKPRLGRETRLVDFGSGLGAYPAKLRRQRYKAWDYEPHRMRDGRIDLAAVRHMILTLEKAVATGGLFDIVVLDGVLNSITSDRFEHLVLVTCNALMTASGTLCLGTRNLQFVADREDRKQGLTDSKRRYIQFPDKDKYAVSYRAKGIWTLQKFHTVASLEGLLKRYFGSVEVIDHGRSDIYAVCQKPLTLDPGACEEALNIEFNMELPDERRPEVHQDPEEAG